jgi:tetratricopeptide (TPR) repeat protein
MMPTISNRELKQANDLRNNWKLKEALKLLDKFDKNKDLSTLERFHLYILKSSILMDLFNSEEAMKFADLAYEESKKLESDYQIICALFLKARIFAGLLEFSKHLEIITEAEEILARNNQKSSQEFRLVEGHVLLLKGTYNLNIGDLNNCFKLLGEASQLAKEINDKRLILLTTKWLGFAYSFKGEIDRAIKYEKRYLTLAIEYNDLQEIIGAHNALGMGFTSKGEIKKAIEHLEKSLSLCYKIKSWKTLIVYTSLFDAYLGSDSLEKAQKLQNRMRELVKQGTYKFNEQIYRLQEATLLKKKPDEPSRSKAEKIFKEVADKDITNIEWKIYALVNICDLYLTRLKETSNLKELDKTLPYIDKIHSIVVNEGILTLLVEMHLLQAKLKLLSFDFKEAQQHLTKALDVAHIHGLNLLLRRVEEEQTELSKNFIKWEKLRKVGGTISARMDLARIDKQIQILLQKRNYLKGISIS